jgi:hypothetical protein
MSDHDPALSKAVAEYGIWHGLCIHHVSGNIVKNLARLLGNSFDAFFAEFWKVYYAISPEELELGWGRLLTAFPLTQEYLQSELWPTRERWAWTYVMTRFTCGVRTSGRIESEHQKNRDYGNSKTPLHALVEKLIERSDSQNVSERLRDRQVCPSSPDLSSLTVADLKCRKNPALSTGHPLTVNLSDLWH